MQSQLKLYVCCPCRTSLPGFVLHCPYLTLHLARYLGGAKKVLHMKPKFSNFWSRRHWVGSRLRCLANLVRVMHALRGKILLPDPIQIETSERHWWCNCLRDVRGRVKPASTSDQGRSWACADAYSWMGKLETIWRNETVVECCHASRY